MKHSLILSVFFVIDADVDVVAASKIILSNVVVYWAVSNVVKFNIVGCPGSGGSVGEAFSSKVVFPPRLIILCSETM